MFWTMVTKINETCFSFWYWFNIYLHDCFSRSFRQSISSIFFPPEKSLSVPVTDGPFRFLCEFAGASSVPVYYSIRRGSTVQQSTVTDPINLRFSSSLREKRIDSLPIGNPFESNGRNESCRRFVMRCRSAAARFCSRAIGKWSHY